MNPQRNAREKSTAIIIADGFEVHSLTKGLRAIRGVGNSTPIIYSHEVGPVKGWKEYQWDGEMIADSPLSNFRFEEHDSLFIPNGILGVDQLRQSPALQRIVHQFFKRNLIVAVVGHAVSVLADEGLLEDRKVAAPTSLKQAIIDSGGIYNDQDVVRDQNLLTSTGPEVMDQFNHYLMIQLSVARATEEKSRIANR